MSKIYRQKVDWWRPKAGKFGKKGRVTANWYWISFWDDENVQN